MYITKKLKVYVCALFIIYMETILNEIGINKQARHKLVHYLLLIAYQSAHYLFQLTLDQYFHR